MAITQNLYTGNGSTTNYSFTFPYISETDVKVSLDAVDTTAYTFANATTIQFNTAPANGVNIRIYRLTDDSELSAEFYSGSAIRAQDLNDNFTQNLYVTQETKRDVADAVAGQIPDGSIGTSKLADGAVTDVKVTSVGAAKATFTQIGTDAVQRSVESKLQDTIHVKDYASGLSSGDDWTVAIQRALNELESRGGGICQLPEGTLYISIAESANANTCLMVPANVIFQGAGMDATIIQRLPSERGTNGVLITNKYWDTNGGYTAAGNIVFQDFTITDGAASPQRTSGDLIGLGHADNVIVQRVKAGNHDQHFVDICGCKRVKVLDCIGYNEHAGTYSGSSTVQVDGVASGAIRGIYVDSTPTIDTEIAGNHFVNKTTNILCHIGHKPMVFKNINVHDNYFDGGYTSSSSVIACDQDCSFVNLTVCNNTVICNNALARCINFFVLGNSAESIYGMKITGNDCRGSSRAGIYAGSNASYSGSVYPEYHGLIISGNTVDINVTGTNQDTNYCIQAVGFQDALISNNSCTLTQTSDTRATQVIRIDRNKSALVTGNLIKKKIANANITNFSVASGVDVVGLFPNVGACYLHVSDNVIAAAGMKYLLNMPSTTNLQANTDNVVFSKNTMSGTFDYPGTGGDNGALIWEHFAASDSTNFRTQVDFGSGTYTKTLAAGEIYSSLPLPGRKKTSTDSIMSPASVELFYAPNSSSDFDTDGETLKLVYISSTSCAGTQVVDVNQAQGTFAILTGVTGTSCVINNSTFQPVIRTGGYLKAFASI